jgi:hypothetical protein
VLREQEKRQRISATREVFPALTGRFPRHLGRLWKAGPTSGPAKCRIEGATRARKLEFTTDRSCSREEHNVDCGNKNNKVTSEVSELGRSARDSKNLKKRGARTGVDSGSSADDGSATGWRMKDGGTVVTFKAAADPDAQYA